MKEYHSWNSFCFKNVIGTALGVFAGFVLVPFFSFLGDFWGTIALAIVAIGLIGFAFDHILFGFLKAIRRKKHQTQHDWKRPKYASPILVILATLIGIVVGLIKLNVQSGAA